VTSPFEIVILRLKDLGFFQFFLPFILTGTIFYGLLRKSKLFGEPEKNIAINAVISFIAAFMVWSAPIITGVDMQAQMARFFMQGLIAMLVPLLGILVIGMFLPEGATAKLEEAFKGRARLALVVIVISVFIGILFSSGLGSFFFPSGISIGVGIGSEWILLIGMIILFVLTVFAIR